MTSKVVHHVSFGAELLPTLLGTLEWAYVFMHEGMHVQVVPIAECFSAPCVRTLEVLL